MRLKRKKRPARVEMLPLMDIIFLLLVFFIYAMMSMATHRALHLNLPSSSQAEPDHSVSLALSVAADGSLYLDNLKVTPEELTVALELYREAEVDADTLSLQVYAEDSVPYQNLYQVLDRVKAAGITRVSLQARLEHAP